MTLLTWEPFWITFALLSASFCRALLRRAARILPLRAILFYGFPLCPRLLLWLKKKEEIKLLQRQNDSESWNIPLVVPPFSNSPLDMTIPVLKHLLALGLQNSSRSCKSWERSRALLETIKKIIWVNPPLTYFPPKFRLLRFVSA